jgi:hypothetical protein
MIYTVELNFSDAPRADEWNAWYETYLQQLVTLPGLPTAQRFKAVAKDAQHWEYLALYSLDSLDVYDSDAYRAIGGGGNASVAYKGAITRRRNVYQGIERMPEVTADARVVLCEDAPYGVDLPDVLFAPLEIATGPRAAGASRIDGTPERRSIAVMNAGAAERLGVARMDGLAVYAPITKRYGVASGAPPT